MYKLVSFILWTRHTFEILQVQYSNLSTHKMCASMHKHIGNNNIPCHHFRFVPLSIITINKTEEVKIRDRKKKTVWSSTIFMLGVKVCKYVVILPF